MNDTMVFAVAIAGIGVVVIYILSAALNFVA